ncbi:MAG: Gx transporter family protein [Candidatus Magnetoovum sp. WYHC-5]|nr:Gx transporter family protein [Candidatus Magnetoovum sp. WYHC-5]
MEQQDKRRVAVFCAYAVALHGVERLIPSPVPWLRFGFANIITIVIIVIYGLRSGLILTIIRVTVGSILFGTFLGPAYVLSLAGGVFSTMVMGTVHKILPTTFSPFGLSLFGAITHSGVQVIIAYFLFINSFYAIAVITPVIMLFSTLTGALNGVASVFLLKQLQNSSTFVQNTV